MKSEGLFCLLSRLGSRGFPLGRVLGTRTVGNLVSRVAAEEAELKLVAVVLSSEVSLQFLPSLSAFGFFNLDEDEDEDDFNWARVCDEDATEWLLLLLEEGCFGLSVQARAVFEEVRLSWLISA